jgi:hypothetical protein
MAYKPFEYKAAINNYFTVEGRLKSGFDGEQTDSNHRLM